MAQSFDRVGRGRATRARPASLPQEEMPEEAEEPLGDGDNVAAVRARGTVRPLHTIPRGITVVPGNMGSPIDIMSNFFRIKAPADAIIYQYDVKFDPQIESPKVRRALLYSQGERLGPAFVFDGSSDLKTLREIDPPDQSLTATRSNDGTVITITLAQVGTLGFGSFEMLRFYNTQMRRNLFNMGMQLIGRFYFGKEPVGRVPDYGGIEVLRGVATAINTHDGGILMNTQTIFKFVRHENARNVMQGILQRVGQSDWKNVARKELAGQVVLTKYNNKTYKIDDIDFGKRPTDQFDRGSRGMTSYINYYQEQYEITIQDQRQPLLVCMPSARDRRAGHDNPIYLVPELCTMTGVTDSMRANRNFMQKLTQSSKLFPDQRVAGLRDFINKLHANATIKEEMSKWNLDLEAVPVRIKGRVLPTEKLLMGNEVASQGTPIERGDFGTVIRGKPMPKPVTLDVWGILGTDHDKDVAKEFSNTLQRVCDPMGVSVRDPRFVRLVDDRPTTYVNALRGIPPKCKMVVCFVPNNNKDRYDNIKLTCCCEKGVNSQVIVRRTFDRKDRFKSITTKIGIQMACKLGAEAWRLEIPPKNMMVVGYDTYHDSLKKGRSAGGFVSSLNNSITMFYSRVSFHDSREEMSSNFAVNIANSLKRYFEVNGRMPEQIMIYRDGVGEGNIRHVFEYEVEQVRKAIRQVAQDTSVRLTFTIISKQVNARFFAVRGSRTENPPPGTVIDTEVTRKQRYDFYLISQNVGEGTVTPTMFDMIVDESGWKAHHHQCLAYKLTHLYYNWQGTVKVPAPCQYAHKLAFLAGQSLHKEPDLALSDTLFYL